MRVFLIPSFTTTFIFSYEHIRLYPSVPFSGTDGGPKKLCPVTLRIEKRHLDGTRFEQIIFLCFLNTVCFSDRGENRSNTRV